MKGGSDLINKTSNSVSQQFAFVTNPNVKRTDGMGSSLKTAVSKASNGFDDILNQFSQAPQKEEKTVDNITKESTKTGDVKKDALITNNDPVEKNEPTEKNLKTDSFEKGSDSSVTEVDSEIDEETSQVFEEAAKELISDIAEKLEVSEDEVMLVMQTLGLGLIDVLTPQNLQDVVTAVMGQDGMSLLVTDSESYDLLQDLLKDADDMRSELMNELNLSEDELETAISEFKDSFTGNIENITEKEPEVFVKVDQLPIQNKQILSNEQSKVKETVHEEIPDAEEMPVERPQPKSFTGDNKEGSFGQNNPQPNLFNQVVQNIADAAVNAPPETVSYTDRAQMENIIRQITEKITITAGEEETQIELQLHPASLGNVNILLSSSKDGGIIAKFTAQNEIVKEAVETQMMTLQQKFDEQGIKVTSIEVTVASHAFEQNLQQEGGQNEAREEAGKGRKSLRRINLSEIDEEIMEEMSEEEQLSAKMMELNGNTVDFSA